MKDHDHEPTWTWWQAAIGIALAIFFVWAFSHPAVHAHEGILEDLGDGNYRIVYLDDPVDPDPPPKPSSVTWHVSPQGDDGNLGIASSPFRTIQRAFSACRGAQVRCVVSLAGGRYARETIYNTLSYENGITVTCPGWQNRVCEMDGEHATSFFYQYEGSPGECQNVTFENLTLDRYVNWGFLLRDPLFRDERANRDANWNGCNTIRNVRITRFGGDWGCNRDFTGNCKGFGGITGQNSDRNKVEDLVCKGARNAGRGGGVHCVYWANGSGNNTVDVANCTDATSSCFKLRDDSNFNEFLRITCKDTPQCFFSGAPGSRPEETQDRNAKLQIVAKRNVDELYSCVLRPGGSKTKENCERVFR